MAIGYPHSNGSPETTNAVSAVALIGAPTDIGAAHRGSSMGPEALRVAGLGDMLGRLGLGVTDLGNLADPANPNAAAHDGYRHLAETAAWCTSVDRAVYETLWS